MVHHQRQDLMQMTENMVNYQNNDGINQQHPEEVRIAQQFFLTYRQENFSCFVALQCDSFEYYRTLVLALMMI